VYDHGSLLMQFIDITHAGQKYQKISFRQKGEYWINLPLMDD